MSQPNGSGSDPIDRLHIADPVRADGVPDASLARVSASIEEHIMTDLQQTATAALGNRRFAVFGGLAGVGALPPVGTLRTCPGWMVEEMVS